MSEPATDYQPKPWRTDSEYNQLKEENDALWEIVAFLLQELEDQANPPFLVSAASLINGEGE